MTDRIFNTAAPRTLAQDRFLLRVGMDYFLKQIVLLGEVFEGDMVLAAVFAAISHDNVRHLNDPLQPSPLATEGVYPDGMRRAVTVASIARSLGIPRETTRRHVQKLIALGYCKQAGSRGVLAPSEVMRSPALDAAARAHGEALDALLETCARSYPPAPKPAD